MYILAMDFDKSQDDIYDVFSLYDKKGNGTVSCSDLGDMMRALGNNPTEEDVNKVCQEIDPS